MKRFVQGRLQKHLPNHVGEASGPDVFTEDPFEDGEGGLGHPSEAVADPSLPFLRISKVLHGDPPPDGAASGPA